MSTPAQDHNRSTVAVLVSGGLDSAVLVASEAQSHVVQPIYVSSGLSWEPIEQRFLGRSLGEYNAPHAILPLVLLQLPLADVYPVTHWAVSGRPLAHDASDADLYLAGRNITLLAKAGIYCAFAGIGRISMGQLRGNPFPDATPEFFATMARVLSLGLERTFDIAVPFISRTKADVIRLGASLRVPFELTMSCLDPRKAMHCGACNKCRERREAFAVSRVADPTVYDSLPAPHI